MAAAIGVDISNPDDLVASLVRIGIADLNPSRVLKDCSHLFITLGSRGLIADLLRLLTMGQKIIHCTFHKYAPVGWELDPTYGGFKERLCSKCPDGMPLCR